MKKLAIMLLLASLTATASEVELSQSGNVYHVPVRINNQITLNFILDSGASDVQIPLDVIRTLIRAGTIGADDFLENKDYVQADGSTVTNERLLIKRLQVGDVVIENVSVSVGSNDGSLLLGQSFLSRFSSWSIDNRKQALVLGDEQDAQPDTQQPTLSASATDKLPVVWQKDGEYGIRILATDIACRTEDFASQGYPFAVISSIPVSRLKKREDAYSVSDDGYAATVAGCWSPARHKAIWHRKHDGKEWVSDFMVDNTWVKF